MKRPGAILLVMLFAVALIVAAAVIFWPWLRAWLPESKNLEAWITYLVVDLNVGRWGSVATLLLVAVIELVWALTLGRKSQFLERQWKRLERTHAKEVEVLSSEITFLKDERTTLLAQVELREDLIREERTRLWAQFDEIEHTVAPVLRDRPEGEDTGLLILRSKLTGIGQPDLSPELRSEWLRVISQLERIQAVTSVTIRSNHAAPEHPHHEAELLRLGNACHGLGQLERALVHYNRAIELIPGNQEALINRAVVKLDLGRYQAALKDLDRALKLGEGAWGYLYRGLIQERLGEERRAQENYSRAIRLDPTLIEAHYLRALQHLRAREYGRALQDANSVIELDGNHAKAYAVRGRARAALGDTQQAIRDLDIGCVTAPQLPEPLFHRGFVRGELGMHAEALNDLTRAIELDPSFAAAYMLRGQIYTTIGDYRQALADYDRTLELEPKKARAYDARGQAWAALDAFESAIQDFDQALELDPDNARSLSDRGTAYQQLGQQEQAISDLDRALELDPNLASAYYFRALAYGGMGEYDKASRDLDRAAELDASFSDMDRSSLTAPAEAGTAMPSGGNNSK